MTAEVEKYTICGIAVTCIQTPQGGFLYEQKRPLTFKGWLSMIIKSMFRAGFSPDEINSRVPEIATHENYFNRRFYKPVREVVQREIELAC